MAQASYGAHKYKYKGLAYRETCVHVHVHDEDNQEDIVRDKRIGKLLQ